MARGELDEGVVWIIYVMLTMVIVLALVYVPLRIFGSPVQAVPLDAQMMELRLLESVNARSPVLGVQEGVVRSDLKGAGVVMSEKQWGYWLFVSPLDQEHQGVSLYGNKAFYVDVVDVANVRFNRFQREKLMRYGGGTVAVKVDQIYPREYEQS